MSKLHDHGVDELFSDPQLFRALINQANCHLSIIDFRSGRYLYVNEMTCRSTGYTPREFLAMTVADIDPTVNRKWDAAKERLRLWPFPHGSRTCGWPTGRSVLGH